MWHSWGHPSALHIKALSACVSMLIRRKWPSTSHMSLHSSDTVCKSFFSPSFCVFFLHTPHLVLCFALWTMPLLSVQSEPDTVLSGQASHLWMEATGSCERRGLTASQRIEWPTYSEPPWDGGREMCVSEPYEIKRELQGVTVCMCLWKREMVLFYSLLEVTIARKTQGHRRMNTARSLMDQERVSSQYTYLTSNKLHLLCQTVFTFEIMLHTHADVVLQHILKISTPCVTLWRNHLSQPKYNSFHSLNLVSHPQTILYLNIDRCYYVSEESVWRLKHVFMKLVLGKIYFPHWYSSISIQFYLYTLHIFRKSRNHCSSIRRWQWQTEKKKQQPAF